MKRIINQYGFNVGYANRLHFASAFSKYVLQTELPKVGKFQIKFTKFSRDIGESTVEHVAKYHIEAGGITNNEPLEMKYFPNSLIKKCFNLVYYLTFLFDP